MNAPDLNQVIELLDEANSDRLNENVLQVTEDLLSLERKKSSLLKEQNRSLSQQVTGFKKLLHGLLVPATADSTGTTNQGVVVSENLPNNININVNNFIINSSPSPNSKKN
jgi:hypothetical protein